MVKKTLKKDSAKEALAITEKLLSMMGVSATVVSEENDLGVTVKVDAGDSSGLLIGNRGRTLQSLQTIISMMLNTKSDSWVRVTLDISSWRQKEEERLVTLAMQTAERVRTSTRPQNLYNLNATQRRIVHMALSEEKDIKTESKGEGVDRYLEVSLA